MRRKMKEKRNLIRGVFSYIVFHHYSWDISSVPRTLEISSYCKEENCAVILIVRTVQSRL